MVVTEGENIKAGTGETTVPDVGSLLTDARKSRGLTDLDHVARELCIRTYLLEALEQNNFSAFPSACYASGFLKTYATYLGLDAASVVRQFKGEYEGATRKVELVFPEVQARAKLPRDIAAGIGGLSLVIMLGVGMMFGKDGVQQELLAFEKVGSLELSAKPVQSAALQEKKSEDSREKAPEAASEKILASVEEDARDKDMRKEESAKFTFVQQATANTDEDDQKNVRATAVVNDRIRLTAAADTWVRISGAGGEILFDRVVQEGEEFFAPDRKGLTLMTSNASALSLYVGDVAISPLGDYGQIVSELALDQKRLLQKTALLQP